MEENYKVFLNVHSDGRLVNVPNQPWRTRTHQYVDGISFLWSPHSREVRNFNWFINELLNYCHRNLGARFFYERVLRRGIRRIDHIIDEGDVIALAQQAKFVAFTNIYIVYPAPTDDKGSEVDPESSVGSNH